MAWTWSLTDKDSDISVTNGGLTAAYAGSPSDNTVRATASASTEKVYWELLVVAIGSANGFGVGVGDSTMSLSSWPGASPAHGVAAFRANVAWDYNGAGSQGAIPGHALNDRLAFALDATAQLIWMTKDGTTWYGSNSSGNPATGANGFSISAITGPYFPYFDGVNDDTCTAVPDAASWVYTPPSGFGELGAVASNSSRIIQVRQSINRAAYW